MSNIAPHMMVMAGGTGGHVFPALAVALELKSRGARITWLGTKKGLEARVVPENNIDIEWISIEGVRGKGLLSLLGAPFKLLRAVWQSVQILRRTRPDCVLGMGGFVAGPGGLASWLIGTPLLVHEQNAVAGLTNKYLAKISQRVMTGFPEVIDLPSSAKWVGNPVRPDISSDSSVDLQNTDLDNTSDRLRVLVIGGSQGAFSFNKYLPNIFASLEGNIQVWHQTGKGNRSEVEQRYADLEVDVEISEFIQDMAYAYHWADLLVCRAGAMTIAELCASAKPALLIPYPFSAGDHQMKNAEFMRGVGAALICKNESLADGSVIEVLQSLVSDRKRIDSMGRSAKQLHTPNALLDVVQQCEEFLHA